jgi:hypothetical protein
VREEIKRNRNNSKDGSDGVLEEVAEKTRNVNADGGPRIVVLRSRRLSADLCFNLSTLQIHANTHTHTRERERMPRIGIAPYSTKYSEGKELRHRESHSLGRVKLHLES